MGKSFVFDFKFQNSKEVLKDIANSEFALKGINKELNILKKQNFTLDDIVSQKAATRFDELLDDQAKLKQRVNEAKAAIIEQNKAIAAAKYPVDSIKGMTIQVDKLRNSLRAMNQEQLNSKAGLAMQKQAKDLSDAINKQSKAFGDNSKNIGNYANNLKEGLLSPLQFLSLASIGAGITAAGVAAVGSSVEIEKLFFQIRNLTQSTDADLNLFKDNIVGISNEIGIGQESLLKSLFRITSAGIAGQDALDLLKISAKASAIGLGEANVIAGTLAGAINAYGKENLTAAHAAEILFQTVRLGSGEVDELAGPFATVTTLAAKLGISIDEVGGAIASITNKGVKAAESITQLESIMTALAKPTAEGEKQLSKLNISYDELRRLAAINLPKALQFLNDKLGGNVEKITDVLGRKEALLGFFSLTGDSAAAFAENVDKASKSIGELDKANENLQKTTQQRFNEITTKGKNFAIGIVDDFKAVIVQYADVFNGYSEYIQRGFTLLKRFVGADIPINKELLDATRKLNDSQNKQFFKVGGDNTQSSVALNQADRVSVVGDSEDFEKVAQEVLKNRSSKIIKASINLLKKQFADPALSVGAKKAIGDRLSSEVAALESQLVIEKEASEKLKKEQEKRLKAKADYNDKLRAINKKAADSLPDGLQEFKNLPSNASDINVVLAAAKAAEDGTNRLRAVKQEALVLIEVTRAEVTAAAKKLGEKLPPEFEAGLDAMKSKVLTDFEKGLKDLKESIEKESERFVPIRIQDAAKKLGIDLSFNEFFGLSSLDIDDQKKLDAAQDKYLNEKANDLADLMKKQNAKLQKNAKEIVEDEKKLKEARTFNLGKSLFGIGRKKEETPEEAKDRIQKRKEQVKESLEQAVKEIRVLAVSTIGDIAIQDLDDKQKALDKELELDLAKLEKEYEAKKSFAQGNAQLIAKLDQEQADKAAVIQKEAAKKQAKLNIQRVIVEGAVALAKTFAYYGFTPFSAIAAALQVAATLKQIAIIKAQGFAEGGEVKKRKRFVGVVQGSGTDTSDSIPAWLSNREYVLNVKMKEALGVDFLERLRSWTLGRGGKPVGAIARLQDSTYSNKAIYSQPAFKYASGGQVGQLSGNFIPNLNLQPVGSKNTIVTVSDESMVNFTNHFAETASEMIRRQIAIGLKDANMRIDREELAKNNSRIS